jgi:TAT (twin-arginine translocation) pathway signal sequence
MYSRRSFLKTGAAAAASLIPFTRYPPPSPGLLSRQAGRTPCLAHAGSLKDGSSCRAHWADHGRPGTALRLPSGSLSPCRTVSMPMMAAARMFPTIATTGWYRTHVPIANPFKDGRTLLHFTIAGLGTLIDNRGTAKASRVKSPSSAITAARWPESLRKESNRPPATLLSFCSFQCLSSASLGSHFSRASMGLASDWSLS